MVDPIDGTKEFIKRNGEFTVNIALIKNHIPVLGVIYAPVLNELYFSYSKIGAYKASVDLNNYDVNCIEMNDIARISIRSSKLIFYDSYKKNRQTGSLIIIDNETNETIGAAMIIK